VRRGQCVVIVCVPERVPERRQPACAGGAGGARAPALVCRPERCARPVCVPIVRIHRCTAGRIVPRRSTVFARVTVRRAVHESDGDVDTRFSRITFHNTRNARALWVSPSRKIQRLYHVCPHVQSPVPKIRFNTNSHYARAVSSLVVHIYAVPRPDIGNALRFGLGRSTAGPVDCVCIKTSCEHMYTTILLRVLYSLL
jgi:hypothetical protein